MVWDVRTGQEVSTCRWPTGPVCGLTFAADGVRLATAGAKGTDQAIQQHPGNTRPGQLLPQTIVTHRVAAQGGRAECYPTSGQIEPCLAKRMRSTASLGGKRGYHATILHLLGIDHERLTFYHN